MIKNTRYIFILFLLILLQDAASQNSQVLYYMNLPQNHLANPAFKPSNSLYIGMPALTGVYGSVNTNFLNFSDLIRRNQAGDSLISIFHSEANIDNFINKLKPINYVKQNMGIQLFGLGFQSGRDLYFTLDLTERATGNLAIPKDLFVLGLKGTSSFVGKTINLSGLDGELNSYQEVAMGVSKNIGSKLRIGVRAKLLFGIANISLNTRTLEIKVNEDYSYDLNADLVVNLSAPVKVYTNNQNMLDSVIFDEGRIKKQNSDNIDWYKFSGLFFNTKNLGMAVDLGANYSITDKIQVSASVTDLGFINWKSDVVNLEAASTFKFNGLDVTEVVNGTKTFDQLTQNLIDSLKDSFHSSKTNLPYKSILPTGFSVGGCYILNNSISLGILSHSIIYNNQINEDLSLSANINLGNSLSTSISYSWANNSFNNFGAGLAFRLGIVQFFLLADKIPINWNKVQTNSGSYLVPERMQTTNLRVGINLAFGNNVKKKKDKPMLTEQY
jgi:hypothetical protein